MSIASKVLSLFPPPSWLSMPAAGLDVSDHSVKCVSFSKTRKHGRRLDSYASTSLPRGVIERGRVIDKKKLAEVLRLFAREHNIRFARASLPEEEGYIFPAYVPRGLSKKEVREVLEFKIEENVPLSPQDAIIDYEYVPGAPTVPGQRMVSVSAYPSAVVQEYVDLFSAAGLEVLSLEIEAQAIARAVVPKKTKSVSMIVDIGRKRSGIAVAQGQVVRFTATIDLGGDEIDTILQSVFPDASDEDLAFLKNERGMRYRDDALGSEAFASFAKRLSEELNRYVVYWQTHKDIKGLDIAHQPIEKVILVGGNANILGLPERLENTLNIPTVKGNVWENAFSLNAFVPNLSHAESLGYAPAVGLALHEEG